MLQETDDPGDAAGSVDVAFQIRKCLITKCDGEIGKLQQRMKELRDILARLFEHCTQFIQVMDSRKGDSRRSQPGLQCLFYGLLDMKSKDFI